MTITVQVLIIGMASEIQKVSHMKMAKTTDNFLGNAFGDSRTQEYFNKAIML